MNCEFHGYEKLGCPGCREIEREIIRQAIADGSAGYYVLPWRGDGRYIPEGEPYKTQSLANREAEKLNESGGNYVARFCYKS